MTKTRAIKWVATLHDAGDGSGDSLLELTDDLMKQMDWHLGDELTVERRNDGSLSLRQHETAGH